QQRRRIRTPLAERCAQAYGRRTADPHVLVERVGEVRESMLRPGRIHERLRLDAGVVDERLACTAAVAAQRQVAVRTPTRRHVQTYVSSAPIREVGIRGRLVARITLAHDVRMWRLLDSVVDVVQKPREPTVHHVVGRWSTMAT